MRISSSNSTKAFCCCCCCCCPKQMQSFECVDIETRPAINWHIKKPLMVIGIVTPNFQQPLNYKFRRVKRTMNCNGYCDIYIHFPCEACHSILHFMTFLCKQTYGTKKNRSKPQLHKYTRGTASTAAARQQGKRQQQHILRISLVCKSAKGIFKPDLCVLDKARHDTQELFDIIAILRFMLTKKRIAFFLLSKREPGMKMKSSTLSCLLMLLFELPICWVESKISRIRVWSETKPV